MASGQGNLFLLRYLSVFILYKFTLVAPTQTADLLHSLMRPPLTGQTNNQAVLLSSAGACINLLLITLLKYTVLQ